MKGSPKTPMPIRTLGLPVFQRRKPPRLIWMKANIVHSAEGSVEESGTTPSLISSTSFMETIGISRHDQLQDAGGRRLIVTMAISVPMTTLPVETIYNSGNVCIHPHCAVREKGATTSMECASIPIEINAHHRHQHATMAIHAPATRFPAVKLREVGNVCTPPTSAVPMQAVI